MLINRKRYAEFATFEPVIYMLLKSKTLFLRKLIINSIAGILNVLFLPTKMKKIDF